MQVNLLSHSVSQEGHKEDLEIFNTKGTASQTPMSAAAMGR